MAREQVVYESVIARLLGRKTVIRYEDEEPIEMGPAESDDSAGLAGSVDDFAELLAEFDSPVFAAYREGRKRK